MTKERRNFGQSGEDAAVSYLKNNGYRILERNFRCSFGEVDIIAREGDVICFVEVKARRSLRMGSPLEAISFQKQRKLTLLAMQYLKENNKEESSSRFDVVSVLWNDESSPQIELIKGAFEAGG